MIIFDAQNNPLSPRYSPKLWPANHEAEPPPAPCGHWSSLPSWADIGQHSAGAEVGAGAGTKQGVRTIEVEA